ncbi:hypothetical protein BDZ89DRAFT_1075410, partial [Hymenopellis radicata]
DSLFLYPSRLLPSELLQKIFTFFIDITMSPTFEELAVGNFGDSRDLHTGPWLLSRVSSQWRSIVFDMPHLWTHVNLKIFNLHVNIYSQLSDIEHHRIYNQFAVTTSGWESLGLSLPGSTFFELNIYGAVYPVLESARVNIQSPTPELPVIPPTGLSRQLERAPCLRSVMTNNVVAFNHIFRMHWDLISRFEQVGSVERAFHDTFSDAYLPAVHKLLGKLVNVDVASFCPIASDRPSPVQSLVNVRPYENTSLRHLTLGKVGARTRDELLLRTNLPSLEELSIFAAQEDVSAFVAFLHTTPNLHTLEIRTVASFDVRTFYKFILSEDELVPRLQTLKLRGR